MNNNLLHSLKIACLTLLGLMLMASNAAHASLVRAQLQGSVTYIDGSNTNERMADVLAGTLTAGDDVSMFFEFDPANPSGSFPSGQFNIFTDVIGKWGINFNYGALTVGYDPTAATASHNLTWLDSGNSYSNFNLVDHAALQPGRNTSIQGPHFAPNGDYLNDWIPLQLVLYFPSPITNDAVPSDPMFSHMRFDYVASRLNENQQTQNSQSGINVRWDSVSFQASSAVPVPATIWLFSTVLTGLIGFRRFSKRFR